MNHDPVEPTRVASLAHKVLRLLDILASDDRTSFKRLGSMTAIVR